MRLLKSLNPDVIFFTGDLVNTRTLEIMPWMDLLARIQAPLGVYSILGNHDYGDYTQWASDADKEANFEAMIAAHKTLGWKLLRNEWLPVSNEAGDILQVVGSENWGKRSGFGKQYGNIVQATQGLRTDSPTVLLTHDPSHFDLEVLGKFPFIGLTLCGHTHGMQMGIDIPGLPRWSPASWVYPHWAGHYVFGAQQLYVNRGFGFVGFRGRIGIFPEITCFEFDNSLAYTPKAANETT
jgi:predicted MPP superfamily phosphohydrolase